jgi:hypothetical protein
MTLDVHSGLFDDDLSALAERLDAAHDEAITERVVGAGQVHGVGGQSPSRSPACSRVGRVRLEPTAQRL